MRCTGIHDPWRSGKSARIPHCAVFSTDHLANNCIHEKRLADHLWTNIQQWKRYTSMHVCFSRYRAQLNTVTRQAL